MACHCSHEEGCKITEGKAENKMQEIILYVLSIIVLLVSFLPVIQTMKPILIILAILLAGYELLWGGIRNLIKLNFEEDTLMTIATIAAFALGDYTEACMVVILFKLGEFIEETAKQKSEKNIEQIAKIKEENTNLIEQEGTIRIVPTEEVTVGAKILIKPGEKIPLDCKVVAGNSDIDTSAITGESNPRGAEVGSELLSGSINLTGALTCIVQKDAKNSTATQIVNLVYEASNNKGKTEKFITKFSKIYTPVVILLSILIATIPALFGLLEWKDSIYRSLIFLVASCPCSLIISVPLSFFSCIGAISKKGLLIKGSKNIENLAKADVIAFDKTGTLTTGKMEVEQIVTFEQENREQIINYVVSIETLSNHPIARAIVENNKKAKILEVVDYKEVAGHGLYGRIQGKEVLLGNYKLLKQYAIPIEVETPQHAILISIGKRVVGYILLTEEIYPENQNLVKELKEVGIQEVWMLTGDSQKQAQKIAKQYKVDHVESSLLPAQKLEKVKQIRTKNRKVIFVGDGINDSPVLAEADFSIAMGKGTEIAGSTADSILLSNQLFILPRIIRIAKRSIGIVKFNITFSLTIKLVVLILGALGYAPIWAAILADTGVTLLTVLNAIRIFKF